MNETLYVVSPPVTDSFESMSEDAERRARERGCQCIRPEFFHFVDPHIVRCVVDHTSPWCPLRGDDQ